MQELSSLFMTHRLSLMHALVKFHKIFSIRFRSNGLDTVYYMELSQREIIQKPKIQELSSLFMTHRPIVMYALWSFMNTFHKVLELSHLGMFVTTGCSSRRQFVATASRQDTGSRQQNTDSGRQVTASGQFYKPSQTQESKYSSYGLLLLCRLKWKNGSTFNERNFM